MKKQYCYEYDMGEAEITFEIDTEIFTEKMANEMLGFFGLKSPTPIVDVMKMYALGALQAACGLYFIRPEQVAKRFNDNSEGVYPIKKEYGIQIIDCSWLTLCEDKLRLKEI